MTINRADEKLPINAEKLLSSFEEKTGLANLETSLLCKPDGDYLLIFLANPTERFYSILNQVEREVTQDLLFPTRLTLKGTSKNKRFAELMRT